LDIRVVEGPAREALEAANGVLEVGDFLRLCGLAEVARLGSEANERSMLSRVSRYYSDAVAALRAEPARRRLPMDGEVETYGVARLETSLVI